MLPWYEDFAQKRQLGRVKKLLADRRQLPMAGYESKIVEAVRHNPAVVIAGDTGKMLDSDWRGCLGRRRGVHGVRLRRGDDGGSATQLSCCDCG